MRYYQIIVRSPKTTDETDFDDVIWISTNMIARYHSLVSRHKYSEITEAIKNPESDGIDFFLPEDDDKFIYRLDNPVFIEHT